MGNNKITLEFDDEKDAKEVFESIKKKTEITWNHDTKQAMIATAPKRLMTLFVSKSITITPKPIRI